MLGPDEADDATQDIFFRVWEKLPLYRPDAPFGGWARRLAVNVILRRREELNRPLRQRSPADVDALHAPATGPDARMDLAAGLAALEPDWRDVVVLHDMEGYRHEEIAELLNISVGSSRMRLHRARALLRERLS